MGTNPIRYMWLGLAATAAAAMLVAAPAVVQRQQAAQAEQIRQRCVREFSAKRTWRAEITETEAGSDGTTSVVRQQLLVRKPGEYRLTLHERDTKGRAVTSTTVRTKDAFYTRRSNADGSTELHVIRNVRPSLGVELDNLLGQTVQAVADASPLKIVGGGQHNGTTTDKLELGPGRYVWVDRKTGLPVEEQVVSEGRVAHSVAIESFDDQSTAVDNEFDPETLGVADTTTVEDLGFKPASSAAAASVAIGFSAFEVPAPSGFSADVRGYVDPGVPTGDGPAEAAFVHAFSSGPLGVIVTQVARPGAGDAFVSAEDDGSERVDIGGSPGRLFTEAEHPRLVFVRRGVLVTIEGDLAPSPMKEYAESIR